jgi:hypothetical protein
MRIYTAERFERVDLRNVCTTFAKVEFRRCGFVYCKIGYTESSARRVRIQNTLLKDCAADHSGLGPLILDEVTIDGFDGGGFDAGGLQIVNACAFRHVVLKGAIRRVNISAKPHSMAKEFNANIARLNREFHASVDWAIDISKAEFFDSRVQLDLPAELIRLDPATQAIVRRENLLGERWKTLAPEVHPIIAAPLHSMVKCQEPEYEVVIAGKAEKDFPEQLKSLTLLRESRVAQPA